MPGAEIRMTNGASFQKHITLCSFYMQDAKNDVDQDETATHYPIHVTWKYAGSKQYFDNWLIRLEMTD